MYSDVNSPLIQLAREAFAKKVSFGKDINHSEAQRNGFKNGNVKACSLYLSV
jgi:hypothetical protein